MAQLVCTDIDGTILNKDRHLSDLTLHVISAIRDRGIPVVLASGRGPASMQEFHQLIGGAYPMVSHNGAFVLSNGSDYDSVIRRSIIALPIVQEVIKMSSLLTAHCSLFVRHDWYVPNMDPWANREVSAVRSLPTIANYNELLHRWESHYEGVQKMMCMGESQHIDQLERRLRRLYGAELNIYRSGSFYIEMVASDSDKWEGIKAVAEYMGLDPKESIAFGDNYNDLRMLQEAGIGVAVANAIEEVKAVANGVTSRHDQDGVAQFLQKHFQLA